MMSRMSGAPTTEVQRDALLTDAAQPFGQAQREGDERGAEGRGVDVLRLVRSFPPGHIAARLVHRQEAREPRVSAGRALRNEGIRSLSSR